MKRVLVSGYIGFNNFGDEAIFKALSDYLKMSNYDISVFCNNCDKTRDKYKVKTYYYKNFFVILKAILNCDILVSGGGSLLQNKTSNFSLFYYLFIILIAKLYLKKVIIFSQGIEAIIGKFPEFITKTILKLADSILVRDKNSQKLLKKWNIDSFLTSDPAYSLVQDIDVNQEKNDLVVQLRRFNGINQDFLQNLANSIVKNYSGKINILSLQDEIDLEICKQFKKILDEKNMNVDLIFNKEIDEIIDILNKSKYVISTRLHGLMIANALKSKCFALIYDEKIKTLSDELNIKNIDIKNYQNDELDKKMDEFFNHHLNEIHSYRRYEWDYFKSSLEK